MNRIKFIIEAVVVAATPFLFKPHHKPIEPVKKPAIIKPSEKSGAHKLADTPTTTVPPAAIDVPSSQDKGGLSVSVGSNSGAVPAPSNAGNVGSNPTSPQNNSSNGATSQSILIKNITFYGWPDNDPPGANIALPVIHNKAGGTGTYSDPLTFATKSTFPKGTILYVPYIHLYVIMEDECASCSASHIDIWVNSDGNFNQEVLKCENKLTRSNQEVIVNPLPNLPVGLPLFDVATGVCNG